MIKSCLISLICLGAIISSPVYSACLSGKKNISKYARDLLDLEMYGRSHPRGVECLKKLKSKSVKLHHDPSNEHNKQEYFRAKKYKVLEVTALDHGSYRVNFEASSGSKKHVDSFEFLFMKNSDSHLGCASIYKSPKKKYISANCFK